MQLKICPYLCIIDDPTSCKNYLYEDNACHREQKPVKVVLSYQRTHCLTGNYLECPGYINGWINGFPQSLKSDPYPVWNKTKQTILTWKDKVQNTPAYMKAQQLLHALKNFSQTKLQQIKEQNWKNTIQTRLPWNKRHPSKGNRLEEKQHKQRWYKTLLAKISWKKERKQNTNGLVQSKLSSKEAQEIPVDTMKITQEKQAVREEKPKTSWKALLKSKLFRRNETQEKEKRRISFQDEFAWRNAQNFKQKQRKIFLNRKVWLVILAIIILFSVAFFIPQLSSLDPLETTFNKTLSNINTGFSTFNQNIQAKFFAWVDSIGESTRAVSPTSIPDEDPQTTVLTHPTQLPTPTATLESTPIAPGTPGVAPFIYLTQTETPEPR